MTIWSINARQRDDLGQLSIVIRPENRLRSGDAGRPRNMRELLAPHTERAESRSSRYVFLIDRPSSWISTPVNGVQDQSRSVIRPVQKRFDHPSGTRIQDRLPFTVVVT
jgi:hypothetical protein